MFTLKLYQNGTPTPEGRTVIIETVGLWIDECGGGVKHIRAFKRIVGVEDEFGTPEFFVGGDLKPQPEDSPIIRGVGGNYFDWGVLENAQGKTTQMLR